MDRVQWERDALLELATLWANADAEIRRRVTAAAHAIDGELTTHPADVGEARDDNLRVGFAPPLGFSFSIDEQRRVVSVLHVWQIRKRR
jgi:hypothetical protein